MRRRDHQGRESALKSMINDDVDYDYVIEKLASYFDVKSVNIKLQLEVYAKKEAKEAGKEDEKKEVIGEENE
ncbi:unnamed protein product [Caenorhabditis angaria]|uniref:Uncharacterized protein n=1 Tax=Caenorhabditis angaria TaxID=860376 RepID=A0A9P1ITJ3_9PELO|nr:unnamed protein product [Caenorhabditis angaria]